MQFNLARKYNMRLAGQLTGALALALHDDSIRKFLIRPGEGPHHLLAMEQLRPKTLKLKRICQDADPFY